MTLLKIAGMACPGSSRSAPVLAADIGIHGFGEDLAERLYDDRSDWVHGSHV